MVPTENPLASLFQWKTQTLIIHINNASIFPCITSFFLTFFILNKIGGT